MTFHIGDEVRFEKDGESFVGTIVSVYILPKMENLVDIQTDGKLFYAVSTEEVSLVG